MSNPNNPAYAGGVVPPPAINLPFGTLMPDGQVMLTPVAIEFLQTLWASIQGTGGIIDQVDGSPTSPSLTQAITMSLIDDVATRLSFLVPPPNPGSGQAVPPTMGNSAGFREYAEAQALLARTPPIPQAIPPAVAFADLPPPAYDGMRAFVTDGSVVAAGNFGTVVAGGGANHVPVYWDAGGDVWRIG